MKYCPNCLKECTPAKGYLTGYGCEFCEVLQYSTAVLLDTPDIEKSKEYRLRDILGNLNLDYNKVEELCKILILK